MRLNRFLFIFAFGLTATVAASAQEVAAKRSPPPEIDKLKLQRSEYPATLSAQCDYIGDGFDMYCAFFVSRVTARKSDTRVNEMLLRMYGERTGEEWQNHPMCTTPEVKDIDRHIKVLQVQKKLKSSEEDMIRRQALPAATFCADPTMENYKAYLRGLEEAGSCTIDTTTEGVKMVYNKRDQSWFGTYTPKLPHKPNSEYTIKLDSVTGTVGRRLIFMVTQMLRPKDGGRGTQLIFRAKRADQKHFCGYVEW